MTVLSFTFMGANWHLLTVIVVIFAGTLVVLLPSHVLVLAQVVPIVADVIALIKPNSLAAILLIVPSH